MQLISNPHRTVRAFLLLCIVGLTVTPPLAARDDWQLWLEQKWSVGLTKNVKLIGKTEERYRSDMSDFYTQVAFIGMSWKALPWLKLEPAYHYEWTEQANRDTTIDNRAVLHVTPGWSWGRVHVEDRNRIEFRHVNGRDDWRYRNKSKLSVDVGKNWYTAAPYVADEVFYGARAGEWTRNRVYLGLEKPLTKQLGAEVYYAVDSTRQGRDWNEFHILGLSVSAKF